MMQEGCCSGSPRWDHKGREKLCRCRASGVGRADLDYSQQYHDQWWGGAWACVSNREVKLYREDVKSLGEVRKSITMAETARRKHRHCTLTRQKCALMIEKWDSGVIQNFSPFKIRAQSVFLKEIAAHLISLSSL